MRPRSKLLTKRRLQLPTIREGSEESQRDASFLLSAREQALSSQDYLLSIRHLAHPTFSAPPGGGDAQSETEVRGGAGDHQTHGALTDPLELLYGGPALSPCWEGDSEERRRRRRSVGDRSREGGFAGWHGDGDERDAREGRRRARANSVPRLTSPNCPTPRRKGSCPEVHPLPGGPQTPAVVHPAPGVKGEEEEEEEEEETGGREGGRRSGMEERQKPSLLSQWLSDCKSVWRVKTCRLPAIAEI